MRLSFSEYSITRATAKTLCVIKTSNEHVSNGLLEGLDNGDLSAMVNVTPAPSGWPATNVSESRAWPPSVAVYYALHPQGHLGLPRHGQAYEIPSPAFFSLSLSAALLARGGA